MDAKKWFEPRSPRRPANSISPEVIASVIRHRLHAYLPGSKLPSRVLLARQFGASQRVVRQAIELLAGEGAVRAAWHGEAIVADQPGRAGDSGIRAIAMLLYPYVSPQVTQEAAILGAQERASHYRLPFRLVRDVPDLSRRDALERLCDGDPLQTGWVIDTFPPDAAMQAWRVQGVPFVLLDDMPSAVAVNTVHSDAQNALYRAAETLILLGHRRIALSGPFRAAIWLAGARLRGFSLAHERYGLVVDERLLWDTDLSPPWWEHAPSLRDHLAQADRPTAIVAATQVAGFHILGACDRFGLNVPGEMSIICCGLERRDLRDSPRVPSAWSQGDPANLGRLAVDLLVETGGSHSPANLTRPCVWVDRGTTAPPPPDRS